MNEQAPHIKEIRIGNGIEGYADMHPIGVGGRNIHTAKIILPITGGSEAELQMTEYGLAAGIPCVRSRAGRKPHITLEIRERRGVQPKSEVVIVGSLVPKHKLAVRRTPVQRDFQ